MGRIANNVNGACSFKRASPRSIPGVMVPDAAIDVLGFSNPKLKKIPTMGPVHFKAVLNVETWFY